MTWVGPFNLWSSSWALKIALIYSRTFPLIVLKDNSVWSHQAFFVSIQSSFLSYSFILTVADWQIGDELVIAASGKSMRENEIVFITGTSEGGRTVHFKPPLKYKHVSLVQKIDGRIIETRAEVRLRLFISSWNFTGLGDTITSQKWLIHPRERDVSNGIREHWNVIYLYAIEWTPFTNPLEKPIGYVFQIFDTLPNTWICQITYYKRNKSLSSRELLENGAHGSL